MPNPYAFIEVPCQDALVPDPFTEITAYCMFIGYPRSGHSLCGAVLDAHPEIVISHEIDALYYIERDISRRALFELMLQRNQWFVGRGCKWRGYTYRVPNQWQGRFRRLRVIGDKKGGQSTLHLEASPLLLRKLQVVVEVPLKIVHIVRNPFDNITTISLRRNWPLRKATDRYFRMCSTNAKVLREYPDLDIFTMRHEDLIADPTLCIQKLVAFVGLESPTDYLSDCKGVIFTSPSKSRLKVEWSKPLIDDVLAGIRQYEFLSGYLFEC